MTHPNSPLPPISEILSKGKLLQKAKPWLSEKQVHELISQLTDVPTELISFMDNVGKAMRATLPTKRTEITRELPASYTDAIAAMSMGIKDTVKGFKTLYDLQENGVIRGAIIETHFPSYPVFSLALPKMEEGKLFFRFEPIDAQTTRVTAAAEVRVNRLIRQDFGLGSTVLSDIFAHASGVLAQTHRFSLEGLMRKWAFKFLGPLKPLAGYTLSGIGYFLLFVALMGFLFLFIGKSTLSSTQAIVRSSGMGLLGTFLLWMSRSFKR